MLLLNGLLYRSLTLFPHLLVNILYFSLAFVLGSEIFRFITRKEYQIGSWGLTALSSVSLGLTLLSFYYLLLGLLKLYYPFFIFVPPVSVGLVLLVKNRDFFGKEVLKQKVGIDLLLFLSLFIFLLIFKAFPDFGFDSNWYHLTQPEFYLREHRIFHYGGHIFTSGYPQFMEMLYLPLLSLGNSLTTSIFSLMITFLGLLSLCILMGVFKLPKPLKFLSVALLLTNQTFLYHSGFAYVDNALMFFFTLSLIWMFRFLSEKNRAMLWLSALSLIPVATIKYAGGLWGIPLVALMLQNIRSIPLRKWLVDALVLSLPAIIGLGFWLFRNILEVGYLFDPIGKIPLTFYSTDVKTFSEYISSIDFVKFLPDCLKNLRSGSDSLVLPAIVSVSLILALFRKKFHVLFALFLCLAIWRLMPPGNDFRYFLPALPFVIALGLFGLSGFLTKPTVQVIPVVALSLAVLSQLSPQKGNFQRILPYAIGSKDLNQFKEDYFGNEPFIFYDFENKVKGKVGSKKLLVYGADLLYPPMEKFNLDYLTAVLNPYEIRSFGDLKRKMALGGYDYLLTNRATLVESFGYMKWSDDANDYFALIYKGREPANDYCLYQVK